MGATFTINRIELKRMLTVLGVGEKSIEDLLADLNKMHRHVNVVAFAGMLQRIGLRSEEVLNLLRRVGVDDITISNIFNVLDEDKIKSAYGRVVEISLE